MYMEIYKVWNLVMGFGLASFVWTGTAIAKVAMLIMQIHVQLRCGN
jgi:heme exporter protein D